MKIGNLEIHPLWFVLAACAWTDFAITELSGGPGNLSTAGEIATTALVLLIAACVWRLWQHHQRSR